jgi:serine/threonine protein kinase
MARGRRAGGVAGGSGEPMNDVSSEDLSVQTEWSADELIPFGKYILLDRINSGATAAVYRANVRGEAGFERLVAIKRILPHMAGDRDFVDTFVREAKTVARLAHEGICPIYELGKVGESLYMAVEYIQGKDLGLIMRRLSRRGITMPPLIAAWVTARLCDALDYAHRLKNTKGVRTGMIHRDLSPSNILVSYEGQVKLIDFGLARAVGRAQSTNVDALKKKLSYMSPEMVKGKPLDARSDIFGVGICLYEMVTARKLFAGTNDIDTLKLVGSASVPPPSAVVDDAPDELEIVIMHALERDPDDRFQTAAEMGEALNAYIQKTDPTFSPQRLADWMVDLFGPDIEAEQKRIKQLLLASADPELIKDRRVFFASPSGAAARARAEVERRLSTEPPPARIVRPSPVPKAAPVPKESLRSEARPGGFEEEPTGFYDPDKTKAGPLAFDDEPTEFMGGRDAHTVKLAPIGLPAPIRVPVPGAETGGFDEEPTEIFFNKEDNVGVQELLDEINDVEPPAGPLNKPIIAPELGLPPIAPSARPPLRSSSVPPAPVAWAPAVPWPQSQPEAPKRASSLPIAAGMLLLLAAIFALVARTPVGIMLGLRAPAAGAIEVRTSPPVAANVKLDDIYRGQAPLRMQGVRAGVRRLAIRAEGYLPVTREVQLEGGSTALVDIALVPDRPAPPPEVAPTPSPTDTEQAAGKHSGSDAPANAAHASAEHDDHAGTAHSHRSSTHHAPTGASAEGPAPSGAPAVPPGTPGTLAVNTVPWSLVFIDGRDTGRSTPLLGYPIAPGWHEIRLQTATGQIDIERVQVLPGQTVRITRRF